jgi:hypothetical protein
MGYNKTGRFFVAGPNACKQGISAGEVIKKYF